MTAFFVIAGSWLFAGLLTYLLFPILVKMGKATPFSFIRAIASGWVGLITFFGILILVGDQQNIDEDELLKSAKSFPHNEGHTEA